jgi:hypothetical protein
MRAVPEIRKHLEDLENETLTDGSFTERKSLPEKKRSKLWSWVLEETENQLTY